MAAEIIVLIGLVTAGALAERVRGGWPPLGPPGSDNGAGKARAVRSLIFAAAIFAAGAPWWVALATGVTLWLAILNSHSDCWMVRSPGELLDMCWLGLVRGVGGLSPLIVYAHVASGVAPITAAALGVALPLAHAGIYAMAYRAKLPKPGGIVDDWNAWAELGWGACLGGAIWVLRISL